MLITTGHPGAYQGLGATTGLDPEETQRSMACCSRNQQLIQRNSQMHNPHIDRTIGNVGVTMGTCFFTS